MLVYLRGGSGLNNFTCCHTETEVADQTSYLIYSQHTDARPTSPSCDPIRPGARKDSHWNASFLSHWYDSTLKNPKGASGNPRQWLENDILIVVLPDACRYGDRWDWLSWVKSLWVSKMASSIPSFYISGDRLTIISAYPSLRYALPGTWIWSYQGNTDGLYSENMVSFGLTIFWRCKCEWETFPLRSNKVCQAVPVFF